MVHPTSRDHKRLRSVSTRLHNWVEDLGEYSADTVQCVNRAWVVGLKVACSQGEDIS